MNRARRLPLLGAVTGAVALAALGTSTFTMQRQRSLATSDRYHQVFDLEQAQTDLLRLRGDTALFHRTRKPSDGEHLQAQLDALQARLRNLHDTVPDGFSNAPQVHAAFNELDHTLSEIRPLLASPDQDESQLQRLLLPSETSLSHLATSTYWSTKAGAAEEQSHLTYFYWACSALIGMLIASSAGLIGMLIQQRRRAVNMALHDQLTGLPNRLLFRRRLEEMLEQPATQENGISVMFLDLDDFKDVNDSLGHVAGDALLCALTARLLNAVPGGVVARLGGDEFAVLLPRGGRAAASELASRLTHLLSQPVELPSGQASTSVSIGIATRRRGGDNAVSLLQQADLAMYEAKGAGRGSYHFFDEALSARLQMRMSMEADMREAIGSGQFHVAYQPLVELGTQRITGFEALLRWSHPVRGNVSPAAFIPVAESSGLILQLGEFVLREACRQASSWPDDVKVAVNLSPRQFKTDLVQVVRDALALSSLPAHRLELEITESVLLQDGESIQEMLHAVRALGVRLALDDFGTGYSSLSYLQRYPFDKIKVDQSFVRGMSERPESAAIVELISALATRLGMTTTAEGIEDAELLSLVSLAGCTEGQGYHFDRPMAPEQTHIRLATARAYITVLPEATDLAPAESITQSNQIAAAP